MSNANSNPARDRPNDRPAITIDNANGIATVDDVTLPGTPTLKAKLRPDGRVIVTAQWETFDFTVVPPPEREITITVPPAPTPEQGFDAHFNAIRQAHDPRTG